MSSVEQNLKQEILENRRKLAEKIGQTKVGGKNLARRKHKAITKTTINDDKKLKQVIKKFGVQPFPGVDEVNFFKDDNTILHFNKPEVQAAIQSNSFAIFGTPETKSFMELMPEIIQHIGPKQFGLLKDVMGAKDTGKQMEKIAEEADDDVPNLVGGQQNFEEVSNK